MLASKCDVGVLVEETDMIVRRYRPLRLYVIFVLIVLCLIIGLSHASLGDHLHDFRKCVQVGSDTSIDLGKGPC